MSETTIHLPPELFAPAESSHFEGSYSACTMKSGPDCYDFEEPLAWQVEVTNTGDVLVVAGAVEGRATTSCGRCLERFSFTARGEIEGYYLLDAHAGIPEEGDDDEYEVLPDTHIIDLEPPILAALLLEFPLVPLCRQDCKGLCPTCGKNLNAGACGCVSTAEGEGEEHPLNPFTVLKDFPFDKNA